MGFPLRIAIVLLALVSARPGAGEGDEDRRSLYGPPVALPDAEAPAVEPPSELPGADSETFALWPAGAGPADPPIGALRHVRLQRPDAAWMVEQDAVLFGPGLRVHQVERHGADLCQFTYREVAPGAGRTLRARWPEPNARPPLGEAIRLRDWEPSVVQWSGTERRVQSYPGARGWNGPLGLVEQQRWGLIGAGETVRFEPLSGRPERLRVRTGPLPSLVPGWRWYCWEGPSGEPRGWMLYWKQELAALAWQSGGTVARRIRPAVHAELVAGF